MPYSLPELGLVAIIMTAASVVQGAIAFASGMISVPLLVLGGFSLPEAATINLVSNSVQNLTGAARLWPQLEVRDLVLPTTLRWLTIPLGAFAVWHANRYLSPAHIKQLVGLLLLVSLLLVRGFHSRPRESIHYLWQSVAFTTSGFLVGFATIGGAPMVVYVNSLTWSAAKSRAFLFCSSALALPVTAIVFWRTHGASIASAAFTALLVLPGIFAGLWLGIRLGDRLSKPLFRRITFNLLLVLAVSAIVLPLLFESTDPLSP